MCRRAKSRSSARPSCRPNWSLTKSTSLFAFAESGLEHRRRARGYLSDLRVALRRRFVAAQLGVVRNRLRPAGQIALHGVAAFLHQERMLDFGLDAFRQDRHVEAVTEADDRADDDHGVAAGVPVTR